MEVKGVIKFLRNHFRIGIYEKKSLEIIALLKRGKANSEELKIVKEELEKVWQMWGENMDVSFRDSKESNMIHPTRILLDLERLKQKYFPKESEKDTETSGHFFVDQYFKEKEAKQDYPESEE